MTDSFVVVQSPAGTSGAQSPPARCHAPERAAQWTGTVMTRSLPSAVGVVQRYAKLTPAASRRSASASSTTRFLRSMRTATPRPLALLDGLVGGGELDASVLDGSHGADLLR